ncbi:acylphosphatase [bacterium]|jgi:acylphosphatase|nr:acylphosphatase [bacterium]
MKRIHLFVTGAVQGVGFRYYTREKAIKSNIFGWVKNLSDGRVEIIAEGDANNIDDFLLSISKGKLGSYISNIEKQDESFTGHFNHFYITYNEYGR